MGRAVVVGVGESNRRGARIGVGSAFIGGRAMSVENTG